MRSDAEHEEVRKHREKSEPSNMDIISAFATSEHLQLFLVGNTADSKFYILASSKRNAAIIALLGGHIRSLSNVRYWKPCLNSEAGTAVGEAIRGRVPGQLWHRGGCVIMRDKVYYPKA